VSKYQSKSAIARAIIPIVIYKSSLCEFYTESDDLKNIIGELSLNLLFRKYYGRIK
jgi:hypothetical protein